jgi:hypothetical protein
LSGAVRFCQPSRKFSGREEPGCRFAGFLDLAWEASDGVQDHVGAEGIGGEIVFVGNALRFAIDTAQH